MVVHLSHPWTHSPARRLLSDRNLLAKTDIIDGTSVTDALRVRGPGSAAGIATPVHSAALP